MRILCMIPAMGPGGAERVMAHLIGHFARSHDVSMLTWEGRDAAPFYPLPGGVRYLKADRLGGHGLVRAYRVLSRPAIARRVLRHTAPDVVVSFINTMNVTAVMASLGSGVPVIVSERNDPARHRIGRVRNTLRNRAYARATLIVVPTGRVARALPAPLNPRVRIVGNPVPESPAVARPDVPGANGRMRVIAVGSLTPQKGHDRLIDAFAVVAPDRSDWDLVIVGEGPERTALEARVRRHGLDGRVSLPGVVTDIAREWGASQLLAFPSHYEGFPNALAEGLAAGLPAVGYAGVSGVEDLILDDRTGLLVGEHEGASGLAGRLSVLMADARLRVRLGDAAKQHVAQWAPDRVFARWDAVLAEVTTDRRGGKRVAVTG